MTSLRPRLLLLTPGFAAGEEDYNCIPPLQLLVQEFLKKDVDVQIVALEYPFSSNPFRWHGARVYPCNGRNKLWRKMHTLWKAEHFGRRWLTEQPERAAVLSCWLGWSSFVGERLAGALKIPHFTILMGQDVLSSNRLHFRLLSTERCQRLIALSAFQQKAFNKASGYTAGHLIPWGVTGGDTVEAIGVIGVGGLIPLKNWNKWMKTIALAVKKRPGLSAELIGGGPEEKKLRALARTWGIESNVRLSGELPRPEVLARMSHARVLLHTASFESFGFVLAEAAARGCQLVSTPVGIAPEIGAACADDPETLSDLLLNALDDPNFARPGPLPDMTEVAERYLRLLFKFSEQP